MSEVPVFFDDFSNPELARYYEITPGVGEVLRRPDGLLYEITRAPDGPSSAADHLTIDSLGRPQSPTKKIILRFSGAIWTLEVMIEYDFAAKRNGRAACFWLVNGDPEDRLDAGVEFVRSADLDPTSHRLTLIDHRLPSERQLIELSNSPGDRNWFRISRSEDHSTVEWSQDGITYAVMSEHSIPSSQKSHCVILNSHSFAGGASLIVKFLKILGGNVAVAPPTLPIFPPTGHNVRSLSAGDLIEALSTGHNVDLRDCTIRGAVDLSQIVPPIRSTIRFEKCEFAGPVIASKSISLPGGVAFLSCRFSDVGLSDVDFIGPLSFINCRFEGDTRFIGTHFRQGANFTGSTFAEKPFFRAVRAGQTLSFYYVDFEKGADFSSAKFDGDLSLSDIAIESGSLTFCLSKLKATTRLMATLQRIPQRLGDEIDFSKAELGSLVISSGDRRNRGEQTGPSRWEFNSNLSLRGARVNRLELHAVHLAKVSDFRDSALKSVEMDRVTYAQIIDESLLLKREFYSCFISYSNQDHSFAVRLRGDLEKNGVLCWFAPQKMEHGDTVLHVIREAIWRYDRFLLILSKNSHVSEWVRMELEACLERERQQQHNMLIPIRVDETNQWWANRIDDERHRGEFTHWTDEGTYHQALRVLLHDLRIKRSPTSISARIDRLCRDLGVSPDQIALALGIGPDDLLNARDDGSGVSSAVTDAVGRAEAALERLFQVFRPERLSSFLSLRVDLLSGRAGIDLILEGRIEEVADAYERALSRDL